MKYEFKLWQCGDICQCWCSQIWQERNKVWEGRWHHDDDKDEVEETREELLQICEKYNIKIDCTSNYPWQWGTNQ